MPENLHLSSQKRYPPQHEIRVQLGMAGYRDGPLSATDGVKVSYIENLVKHESFGVGLTGPIPHT